MKTPRIVLDTNCLVSALLFKSGRLAVLRSVWQRGVIQPIVCRETVAELIRVLAYPKFSLSNAEIDVLLAEFLPFAETWQVKHPATPVPGLSDPSDAVFIHLATQSKADMLVSGDAHLLGVEAPGIRIIAPVNFLELLGE
jgi:putative PIN family toxin of toxin-antitoxin system